MKGSLLVITGPSGVGKGTLLDMLRRIMPKLYYSISATTRSPRPGEQEGINYYFIDKKRFEEKIENNDFVEHAQYGPDYYGTLYSEIEEPLAEGRPVILEIELDGARQIKKAFPEAITIFIEPPEEEELRRRLQKRGTENEEQIQRRLKKARQELAARQEFEYQVENDNLEQGLRDLHSTVIEALHKARSTELLKHK